ncbi:ZIP family metal transporter [Roseimaritima ulvae]|uniref:Zinc transporter ZupT n=1 Tax=Roseimaritima ulvae TaxID=980254 RepID=A0A5B9QPW5_9BACT|nr:ZIP family metal transporter [Roseimaritima ulvae]QEG39555.1 zinc transporter ZupT [Roseimaritima ulvae]
MFSESGLPIVVLVVYCIAVVVASLAGGGITQRLQITHNGMQHIISLVGGVMLGTAVFHLLPHALHDIGRTVQLDNVMLAVMAGIVVMFAMLRLFHHHHHGEEQVFQQPAEDGSKHEHGHDHAHSHVHEHGHAHEHDHTHGREHGRRAGRYSWLGVLAGLTIHTLIDGVTLAAAVRMDAGHPGRTSLLFGFGAFLAVFLHKPLDAISVTSMMAAGGKSVRARRVANLVFALACPLGAGLCYAGLSVGGGATVAYLLAFSAGVFLCIALSDLLPEMEFHSHDRFSLSAMLMLGLLAAWMLRFLEGDLHP